MTKTPEFQKTGNFNMSRKQSKNRNSGKSDGDREGRNRPNGSSASGGTKEGSTDAPSSSSSVITPTLTSTMAPSNGRFFTSQDKDLESYIHKHYSNFVHLPRHKLSPSNFHERAKAALERLRDMNYYQYDIVTAGGKHSSRTFVKRCLVGEDGITYKYLGLRLFSHSWGPKSIPALQAIGDMNKMMIEMTQKQAAAEAMSLSSGSGNSKSADDIVGKCNYNLTLINYMEPTSHTSIGFKEESDFGMGKVSVSWHADSSLESNSSIGVYHCLPTQKASRWDWKIALRPAPESEQVRKNSSIAPVVVDTHDGDVYFLLGKMNETHHHAVLAGSQANRISSTHRVAVTGEDTYDYILKRVKIARKRFRAQLGDDQTDKNSGTASTPHTLGLDAKVIRYCQQCLTEVEMEWIAQYWLQGSQHDKMHVWWQKPMKTLEAYWSALEEMTYRLFKRCCFHDDEKESNISIQVLKVLQAEFKNRQSLRQKWDERRADKIYQRRIAPEYRPVARPIFDDQIQSRGRLPKDLTEAINDLSKQIKNANQKTNRNLMAVTRIDIVNVQSNNASRKSPEKNKKRGPAEIRRTTQTNPSYNTKSISTSKRKKKRSKSHNA